MPAKQQAAPPVDTQKADALAYTTLVASDSTDVSQAESQVGVGCGSGDTGNCKSALQAALSATNKFDTDVSGLTVPACLSTADRELRLALSLYEQGDQEAISGIDSEDASQISAGAGLVNQGTTHLDNAASAITSAAASC